MSDVVVLRGGPPRHTIEELGARLNEPLARGGALRAWVFGSRARGTADEYSDLDLIVEVAQSSRPFVERWRDFVAILDVEGAVDLPCTRDRSSPTCGPPETRS